MGHGDENKTIADTLNDLLADDDVWCGGYFNDIEGAMHYLCGWLKPTHPEAARAFGEILKRATKLEDNDGIL